MSVNMRVKRVRENAKLPVRKSPEAAGYDLHAAIEIPMMINVFGKVVIPTGLKIALPKDTVGLIWSRSGWAVEFDCETGAGVIDEDYRGEVKIVLRNLGREAKIVNPGDRIAQILVQKIEKPEVIEIDELPNTERGEGGFGSTGTQ